MSANNEGLMDVLQEDENEDSILDSSSDSDSDEFIYSNDSEESICNDSDWSEPSAIFNIDEQDVEDDLKK